MRKKLILVFLLVVLTLSIGNIFAENNPTDNVVITNIASWNHPVKDVLKQNKIDILKIELSNNRTYPTFYVHFPYNMYSEYAKYFSAVCTKTAEANAYWDFEFIDQNRDNKLVVACNRKTHNVVNILVNGNRGFLERMLGENGKTVAYEKVQRNTVGLDIIPSLDFSKFNLNSRIEELLFHKRQYTAQDYQVGIVNADVPDTIIISDRFTSKIIADITIGTKLTNVIATLGEPSCRENTAVFYKTLGYYLGFYGKNKVEKAIICPIPKAYPKDILFTVAKKINELTNHNLNEFEQDKTISNFFESSGHIHGGGMVLPIG